MMCTLIIQRQPIDRASKKMNPALLNDIDSHIHKDWTAFVDVWQEAKEVWRDGKCRQFEQEDLQPLPGILSQTTAAIAEFREFAAHVNELLRDEESENGFIC